MEKRCELMRRVVDALIDPIAGVILTHLSSLPARCAPRGDLAIRRSHERVVFQVRTKIANVCQQIADKYGEPRLENTTDRCPAQSAILGPVEGESDDPSKTGFA